MPAKKPPKPNEKPQKERFKEAAKQAGGIDDEAFESAIRRIIRDRRPAKK